ncbi:MAG: adenylate/guanylate cyclase domain-containing protein [Geminicoccaceae bacterium]
MASERVERRLAAILAADVEGYSRLMAGDEARTFATLTAHREVIDGLVTRYRGRIANTAGDSILAEFASVVDAVECAQEIQAALAARNAEIAADQRMLFRIGLHVGDVMVKGGDLFGDSVNIAARVQGLAAAGGVCASDAVRSYLGSRLPLSWTDGGAQLVKNIADPIRVYHLAPDTRLAQPASGPALPDRPSIAVLPFQNMSGDVEQEYFADGMVEEIITALSRMRWLFVIARNSSFTYKGRAVDVKQVGRELGVRYVLEGSVRRSGNRLRVTGQLIDTATGAHIWADRFDDTLEDVFEVQDKLTESVIAAIAPRLERAAIERAHAKPTDSPDAYDHYLRGVAAVHDWTRERNADALRHFRRAVELDPGFAAAYGMAARCYSQRKVGGWTVDRAGEAAEAERLARRAAELGRDDAVALATAGMALAYVVSDVEAGDECAERAVRLNPNLAWAWLFSSWCKIYVGDHVQALDRAQRAMRLSPADPHLFDMQNAAGVATFLLGRDDEALAWAERALKAKPQIDSAGVVAVTAALTGRATRAQEALRLMLALEPDMRLSNFAERYPLRRPGDVARWLEGLRLAGLPE